jgi:endonuclease/exonuclease/phosphatase family metal-dependent hydrolase
MQHKMQLKLLTYNIKHGQGMDGRVDPARILDVLRTSGADIIFLNEVDKYRKRSGFRNQAKWLAKRLEMDYRFVCVTRKLLAQTGNAVLTKFPITESQNLALGSTEKPRAILKATVQLNNIQLTCISVHLNLSKPDRLVHAEQINSLAQQNPDPLVLMGDLNALPDGPEVQLLSQTLTDVMKDSVNAATFPSLNPKNRIDYVFISRNCAIIEANVIGSAASDHLPIFAAVEVK